MDIRRAGLAAGLCAAVGVLLALPAAAGNGVIAGGIDLWSTPANGSTFVDFSRNPLPADFFCLGSAPFDGRIVFQGVPVATRPARALGNADTIVQRLDDAVFTRTFDPALAFDLRGLDGTVRRVGAAFFRGQEVATTRIQVKALSFAAIEPVSTGCGRYRVTASLAGEQPVTRMIMVREGERGGRFYAPLALNVRLTFTPVRGGTPVAVVREISFPAKPLSLWTDDPAALGVRREGLVSVDTDFNGKVDTVLPGTSNFAAGFKGDAGVKAREGVAAAAAAIITPYCEGSGIYYSDTHCHGTVSAE
jgi:hypothetical protein